MSKVDIVIFKTNIDFYNYLIVNSIHIFNIIIHLQKSHLYEPRDQDYKSREV